MSNNHPHLLYSDLHEKFPSGKTDINFWLNKLGNPVIYNLDEIIHLLIRWQNGSWKSVEIFNITFQLMEKNTPEELQIVFIERNAIVFELFKESHFLKAPFIYDNLEGESDIASKTIKAIDELKEEMVKRQKVFISCWVETFKEYNSFMKDESKKWFIELNKIPKLPRIIFIIEEFADIIHKDINKEIIPKLANLAWTCRATWINIILTTCHPNAETTPPLLIRNIPSTMAFKTRMWSLWDLQSRIVLWQEWAANLNWNWEALLSMNGSSGLIKLQAPFCNAEYLNNLKGKLEKAFGKNTFK